MTADGRVVDLLAQTAYACGERVALPPVGHVKSVGAHRMARARMLAVAAVSVMLLAAGSVVVVWGGSAPSPEPVAREAPPRTVLTTSSPPPPALLAESASIRWQVRRGLDPSQRSPRRDKI